MREKNVARKFFTKNCVVSLIVLIILVLMLSGWMEYKKIMPFLDNVKLTTGIVAIISLIFTGLQFRALHDWNRRQMALVQAKNIDDGTEEDKSVINSVFNYRHRTTTIPINEILDAICKKGENGECLTDNLKNPIIDNENDIYKSIVKVLNSFEYISLGVLEGVFDKQIIYKLYCGTLLHSFDMFEEFIRFLNRPSEKRSGKVYENLVIIANGFKRMEGKEEINIDYIG